MIFQKEELSGEISKIFRIADYVKVHKNYAREVQKMLDFVDTTWYAI